jgi:nitrite reductase (NADH) small subunit
MLSDVGAAADFDEAKIVIVKVARREIGVVRWRGKFFAMRNICPHLGARICTGRLSPFLQGGPDDRLHVDDDRPLLLCPWHRWEFDASSGRSVTGALRIKTYPTLVRNGRVLVET